MTKVIAVVLLLALTASFSHGIDRNRGKLPCRNLKGKDEYCGPLQFCSKSILEGGCRNCSEVTDRWCSSEENKLKFKTRFPQCAILCDVKECSRLKEELIATATALSESKMEKAKLEQKVQEITTERDDLKEENNALWSYLVGVLSAAGVLLSMVIGMVVYCISKCKQRPKAQAAGLAQAAGTASLKSEGSLLKTLFPCLFKTEANRFPMQPQDEDPGAQSTPFVSKPTPGLSTPASDSGHASNSSSSLTDARLPSGGTLHNLSDTDDFMRNSQMSTDV